MKTYLILFLIVPFVFLAGCTILNPNDCSQNPSNPNCNPFECTHTGSSIGVIIQSFKPDVTSIFSGDSVSFTLTVANTGGEDAQDVKAKLYGLGTDWTGADWTGTSGTEKDLGDLIKSQEGIPGGINDASWDVASPTDLPGNMDFPAQVRVTYKYSTTASGYLRVYNYVYLSSLRPEEREEILQSSGLEGFTVSAAPIDVSIGATHPYRYVEGSDQTSTVTIQIENVGQGYPYLSIGDRKITIDSIKINNQPCGGQSYPQDTMLPQPGSKKSITCSFNIPEVLEFTTIPVQIELSYSYFVDGCSSITVMSTGL